MTDDILACHRVADLPNPNPLSVQAACAKCNEPIWVMPRNLKLPMPKVCLQCTTEQMAEAVMRGEEVKSVPASMAHAEFN